MESVIGTVKNKSDVINGCVWLLIATVAGDRVVRVESDPLTAHVNDSVMTQMHLVITGNPVMEPGPEGGDRIVLIATHVGVDLTHSNVMAIDGVPRPFYLTNSLEITDKPQIGDQYSLV